MSNTRSSSESWRWMRSKFQFTQWNSTSTWRQYGHTMPPPSQQFTAQKSSTLGCNNFDVSIWLQGSSRSRIVRMKSAFSLQRLPWLSTLLLRIKTTLLVVQPGLQATTIPTQCLPFNHLKEQTISAPLVLAFECNADRHVHKMMLMVPQLLWWDVRLIIDHFTEVVLDYPSKTKQLEGPTSLTANSTQTL